MNGLAGMMAPKVAVQHFVKGRLIAGDEARYGVFATPALDIDALVWPRSGPGPAFSTPLGRHFLWDIENVFGRIKDWRRVATRYDRCAHTFMSAISIAATCSYWL